MKRQSPEEIIASTVSVFDVMTPEYIAREVVDSLEGNGYRIVRKPENRKKLTKRDAELIRDMHRAGSTIAELARSFDVHHATVSRIVRRIYHK